MRTPYLDAKRKRNGWGTHRSWWPPKVVLLALLVLPFTFAAAAGQEGSAFNSDAIRERVEEATVKRWADQLFGQLLAEGRFSSLAIIVTKDQDVVFQEGYGYADWSVGTPVDPESSQFRIASLTKLFVAVAIAQLLEDGRIHSLDDPVNPYLKRFQIEEPYGESVTIWDMMTHQGGLGRAQTSDTIQEEARPSPPLSTAFLRAHLPPPVRKPGELSIYCNPCSAVLGFMVEDISGMTMEEYLQEHVYAPLGMTRTVLSNRGVPLTPDVVTQYAFDQNGDPVETPYPSIPPALSYAGDMVSTASDMGRWMITHLARGEVGLEQKLLRPESFDLMLSRERGNHPQASGFGMQIFTYQYGSVTVLEHYGSLGYRTLMILLPEEEIGVFVTMGGGGQTADMSKSRGEVVGLGRRPERALSHSGLRALILEFLVGPIYETEMRNSGEMWELSEYEGSYYQIPADPSALPGEPGLSVEPDGDGGLVIAGIGSYRPFGGHVFVLEGTLPVEAGFGLSNRYVFEPRPGGGMRLFGHVNAGGYQRR